MKKILLAETEREPQERTRGLLEQKGYTVYTAKTGDEAVEIMKTIKFLDVVILDTKLQAENPRKVQAELARLQQGVPCVLLVEGSTTSVVEEAFDLGQCSRVGKDAAPDILLKTIHATVRARKQRNFMSWVVLTIAICLAGVSMGYSLHLQKESNKEHEKVQIYRELVEKNSQGIVVLNPEGRIIEWNLGAEKMFGWKAEEVMGSFPDFMMPDEDARVHTEAFSKRRYDIRKAASIITCWALKKDGSPIRVTFMAKAVPNSHGYNYMATFTEEKNVRFYKQERKDGSFSEPEKE